MKKAQGISMNVIIIAAIALLVLVVLSVMFLTRTGVWSRETLNCRQQGGTCVKGACPDGQQSFGSWRCFDSAGAVQDGYTCCIPNGG